MSPSQTRRYCADPVALAALKRDGLGWGHDLDCGCFRDHAAPRPNGPLRRILDALTKRT